MTGLTADAKSLIDTARVECQSYRLALEDPPTVEYSTRFIAQTKQKFTQSNGKRPYGVSCLIIGFDKDEPKLFSTDPSGVYAEWKVGGSRSTLSLSLWCG
jgi:20S proteasome subunit alpha 4